MIVKEDVTAQARALGAGLVGFAPVERWGERGDLHPDFFPDAVWPLARTVIVLSIPSSPPIFETKISQLHRSLYNLTNRMLDEMGYRLAVWLNRRGCAAIHVCRDGYGHGDMLRKNPVAAFSHVWAGYYAGLGTVGWNHTLLTPEYGPRHRMISVLAAERFEGDPMPERDLCTKCRVCERACPFGAFSAPPDDAGSDEIHSDMDKIRCGKKSFEGLFYAHCGFCVKTCPVGEDRRLFGSAGVGEYMEAHRNFEKWTMGVGGNVDIREPLKKIPL
jgi:epoxyqueuosine reductase QueG